MTPEQYQPTEEEIKKAEEMMTPTQKKLSEDREAKAPLREEFEKNKYSESNVDKDHSFPMIEAVIDGHKLTVKNYNSEDFDGFMASIDGVNIGGYMDPEVKEISRQLWEKYKSRIEETKKGFESSKEDEKKARKEVEMGAKNYQEQQNARNIAKELLAS